ncbi:MAG: hypothetical protein SFV52_03145 [Saprospiraceae bacterium]|nr:hypothetical protein [Saprospiraceae bacterium]
METHLSKSALLALGITVVVLCSLEWRLRSRGVDISYDDGIGWLQAQLLQLSVKKLVFSY